MSDKLPEASRDCCSSRPVSDSSKEEERSRLSRTTSGVQHCCSSRELSDDLMPSCNRLREWATLSLASHQDPEWPGTGHTLDALEKSESVEIVRSSSLDLPGTP
eukprot:3867579-Rhodomonas_salina.1